MNRVIDQFLGCYFHQDWRIIYVDYCEAIKIYAAQASIDNLKDIFLFFDDLSKRDNLQDIKLDIYGGAFRPKGELLVNFIEAVKNITASEIDKRNS